MLIEQGRWVSAGTLKNRWTYPIFCWMCAVFWMNPEGAIDQVLDWPDFGC